MVGDRWICPVCPHQMFTVYLAAVTLDQAARGLADIKREACAQGSHKRAVTISRDSLGPT
jgi:hypothetical protein